VLKRTLLQRSSAGATIIELPRYHVPTLRNVLLRTWDRLRAFVRGAGKVIVLMVMVLSVLSAVSRDGEFGDVAVQESVLADIGRTITPAFSPLGIEQENWPATVGLFTGLLAKEAVVGTLDNLYGALAAAEAGGAEAAAPYSLTGGIAEAFATIPENLGGLVPLLRDPLAIDIGDVSTPEAAAAAQDVAAGTFGAMVERFDGRVGAFAYLLFILLYVPCLAAMGAVYREIGPAWTAFTFLWTTGLAYGVSTLFYQTARFGQDPAGAAGWIAGVLAVLALMIAAMRRAGSRDADRGRAAGSPRPAE
jgi:ferrous iron transport protein B